MLLPHCRGPIACTVSVYDPYADRGAPPRLRLGPSWHPVAVLAAALLCLGGVRTCCGASAEANDAFGQLKGFLDADAQEYEVVFSVVHHSNEAMRQLVSDLQKRTGVNLQVSFDEVEFFRVRRAKDGFLTQRAADLASIETRSVSGARGSAEGMVSNNCWSLSGGLLTTDQGKCAEMNKRLGTNWWEVRADESAYKALSLGLHLRRGSLAWDGTNFIG